MQLVYMNYVVVLYEIKENIRDIQLVNPTVKTKLRFVVIKFYFF